MRPRTAGAACLAIARRDALVELSYQFRLAFAFTSSLIGAFLAYYLAELIGDAEAIDRYAGTYFDFVVVGLAVTAYAGLGVSAFTARLLSEQGAGTLEVLLTGPSPLWVLLAGGFIVPFVLTSIEVALLVGIGVGMVGSGVTVSGVLLGLPAVALTMVNFCALGITSAALLLLVKRGDPIGGPVYQLNLLLSGAILPIEVFPGWLETICRLTPGFYGVRATRSALLAGGGWDDIAGDLAVLVGFAVLTVPLSVWFFGRSVRKAKALGVLGAF